MNRFFRYLRTLDAAAIRTLVLAIILFGGALALLIAGRLTGFIDVDEVQAWLVELRQSPLALPVVLTVFVLAAFVGIPQIALIAAMLAAFGPWLGGFYTWLATQVSGSVTFWFGRFGGQSVVARFGGKRVTELSAFIGRNAFVASLVARIVPSLPFIVINATFGSSQARFTHFLAGMAVGTVPKILLMVMAGWSLSAAMSGTPGVAIGAALAALALWLGILFLLRKRFSRDAQDFAENPRQVLDNRRP